MFTFISAILYSICLYDNNFHFVTFIYLLRCRSAQYCSIRITIITGVCYIGVTEEMLPNSDDRLINSSRNAWDGADPILGIGSFQDHLNP